MKKKRPESTVAIESNKINLNESFDFEPAENVTVNVTQDSLEEEWINQFGGFTIDEILAHARIVPDKEFPKWIEIQKYPTKWPIGYSDKELVAFLKQYRLVNISEVQKYLTNKPKVFLAKTPLHMKNDIYQALLRSAEYREFLRKNYVKEEP